jgi:hypothetical protein
MEILERAASADGTVLAAARASVARLRRRAIPSAAISERWINDAG